MSQPTWIKIADELPPIGEWVWFSWSDPKGTSQYFSADVGRYEGQKTAGDAIGMETLPEGYESDWYPCDQWTRDDVVGGETRQQRIAANKSKMMEWKK